MAPGVYDGGGDRVCRKCRAGAVCLHRGFGATGSTRWLACGAIDKLAKISANPAWSEKFRGPFHDEPYCFKPYLQDETF